MAAVYTVLAVIRVLFVPSKIVLFFMDMSFMCFSAVVTFLYSVSVTIGIVRWYVVLGEAIGFSVFYFTAGRYIKKSSDFVFGLIKRFLSFVFSPVLRLTGHIWGLICKFLKKSRKKMKKSHIISKFRLHCNKKVLYNTNGKSVQR